MFEAQDLDENNSEIINTQQACLAYYKKENDTLRLSINQPYFYFDTDGKAQNETYQITLKKDWILRNPIKLAKKTLQMEQK